MVNNNDINNSLIYSESWIDFNNFLDKYIQPLAPKRKYFLKLQIDKHILIFKKREEIRHINYLAPNGQYFLKFKDTEETDII